MKNMEGKKIFLIKKFIMDYYDNMIIGTLLIWILSYYYHNISFIK